jgi:hypothetical protein
LIVPAPPRAVCHPLYGYDAHSVYRCLSCCD